MHTAYCIVVVGIHDFRHGALVITSSAVIIARCANDERDFWKLKSLCTSNLVGDSLRGRGHILKPSLIVFAMSEEERMQKIRGNEMESFGSLCCETPGVIEYKASSQQYEAHRPQSQWDYAEIKLQVQFSHQNSS